MSRHLLVLLASLWAAPAHASDPTLARYVSDGSQVFWFIQISDSHIDTVLPGEEDRLRWAVTEAVEVIEPAFVVNTGDLTDSTQGIIYGVGPVEAEWQKYRGILDEGGMEAEFYWDLPGNHDAWGDGELTFYLRWSVAGSAFERTQHSWTLDLPFGLYHFFSVATCSNDGRQWPFDGTELTDWEIEEAGAALEANAAASLQLVFGHHDYLKTDGGEGLSALLIENGVGHYFHGHEHELGTRIEDDGVVRQRVESLGQGWRDHLALWAVDADTVSRGIADAGDDWPLVVITAPASSRYGRRNELVEPYVPPVPATCAEAPVRALVFDPAPVRRAYYRWDEGEWHDLVRRNDVPAQWRGTFDASALAPGLHVIEVRAEGSAEQGAVAHVEVVEAPCDLGEPDPDPGPENVPPVAVAGEDREAVAGSPITFDGSASSDPDGEVVAWDWDFGDGAPGEGEQPTHTYREPGTWTVTLTVTDDDGDTATDTLEVRVNAPPVPRIQVLTDEPLVDDPVELDGSGSYDPDGGIVRHLWDFGDGATAEGGRVARLYEEPGVFTVRLTVTDDQGAEAETTLSLTVSLRENLRPTAVIEGPDEVVAGEEAHFDGRASSDEDGEVVAWEWDFGDGTQGEGAEADHVWEEPGSFSLTLWVTDDGGALYGTSKVVVVTPAAEAAEAEGERRVVRGEGCGCRVDAGPAAGGGGGPLLAGLLLLVWWCRRPSV